MIVAATIASLAASWLAMAEPAEPPPPRRDALTTMNTAVELFRKGETKAAETRLEQATEKDPTLHVAWLNLGVLRQRLGRLDDAATAFRAGLPTSTGSVQAELQYRLGAVTLELAEAEGLSRGQRRAKLEQAKPILEAAVASAPKRARAQLALAWCHERLDDPTAADLAYRRAIEADPGLVAAYVGLGNMYIDYGFTKLGLAVLDASTKVAPEDPEAWRGLGHGAASAHDSTAAVAAFERAAELDPDDVDTHFRLGLGYAELQRRDDAIRELEAYLARAGRDTPEVYKRHARNTLARMQDVL